MVANKLKEIIKLQDIIKTDELHYKFTLEFLWIFFIYCFFKRYTWRIFIIGRCWWWQSNFAAKLKSLDKILTLEPTPELATKPTKQKRSKLKFPEELMNEIIADKKNDDIFWNYLKYQNPSL